MGLNQKQAVAVLYGVSAVLGLLAVLLAGKSAVVRMVCLAAAFVISIAVWLFVFHHNPNIHTEHHDGSDSQDKK